MSSNTEYKIITAGGRENGPLDVDTIRRLFIRKLIDENTLVFVQSNNQWMRLVDVFNVNEWKRGAVRNQGETSLRTSSTSEPSVHSLNEQSSISDNTKFSEWNSRSSFREAGCFSVPVIGLIVFFMVVLTLLTGSIAVPRPLLWIAALAIVGWFGTIKYRRNMEKRLGRKVKGDLELTSITSWMEAASKEGDSSEKK